jgi:CBS-domain-containing membrane protein
MLLRKRAWDMLRPEAGRVKENVGLPAVVEIMRNALRKERDNDVVLVMSDHGKLKGTVEMHRILKHLEKQFFAGEQPDIPIGKDDGRYWDELFARVCSNACDIGIEKLVEKNPPVVQAQEPLLLIVDVFLRKKDKNFIVVEDDGKVLGLVFRCDLYLEVADSVLSRVPS